MSIRLPLFGEHLPNTMGLLIHPGVNGKASLEGPTVCLGAEEMYASLSYVQGYMRGISRIGRIGL